MQSSGYRHLESFESMKVEDAEKFSHWVQRIPSDGKLGIF